jgi:site-specific DNA-methyltransferase (adenine-specific)
MFDIVSKLCLPGQSILDPFMGAGTTGIAAVKHGCTFDGLDSDKQNVEISKVRISQALMGCET